MPKILRICVKNFVRLQYAGDYYINKNIIATENQNYHKHPKDGGDKDIMRVGLEEIGGPAAHTYLKYDISGLPAANDLGEVSLNFNLSKPTTGKISVYGLHSLVDVANSTPANRVESVKWTETTITALLNSTNFSGPMSWDNNKLISLTDSIDTIDINPGDTISRFNITNYIKAKKAAGAATVDLLLKAETPCNIELRGRESTEAGAAALIPSFIVSQQATGLHQPQAFTPQVKFKYNTDMKPIHDAAVFNPVTSTKTDGNKNYHEISTANATDDKMNSEPGKSYTYFKFDISGFPASEQIGTTVFSVFGRDTSKTSGATSENYAVIYGVSNSDWKETEITWSNKPDLGAEITRIIYQSANTVHNIDITNYVKTEKGKGAKYITVALVAENGAGVAKPAVLFQRGKNSLAGTQPKMTVANPGAVSEVPEYLPLEAGNRSRLYPENWYPGFEDEKGRFLHDFSYAGYHRGEREIPATSLANSIDVTKAPYNADNTGTTDATPAIQAAIDAAAAQGGGVVYLPAGTYQVKPQEGKSYSLAINSSNIVLKGASMNQTFIYNADEFMKQKSIIYVGTGDWKKTSDVSPVKKDELEPTTILTVEDASKFQVNDNVLIDFTTTQEFLNELGMQIAWSSRLGYTDPVFYRKIMAVDAVHNAITLDIPTRYPLRQRDSAKVTKVEAPVSEIGLEDFSIANVQNSKSGLLEDDYKVEGTAGYDSDNAKAINVVGISDSWIRNINTYKPAGNADYHILSKGIILDRVKNVTVDNCTMEYPQYRGANGNGYLYQMIGNDCLIKNSKAIAARHSFTFANMSANGNVLYNNYSENPSLASDFHMYLSMVNLVDNYTVKGDKISAMSRPYGSNTSNQHGVVTTESVFWNTIGKKVLDSDPVTKLVVESEQFGYGYVIGTQGDVYGVNVNINSPISGSNTRPYDMAEGVGQGKALIPQSLYNDQFDKRMNNKDFGLKALTVNGEVVSGMQSLKTKYTYTFPFGTTATPVINASAAAAGASVTITQPAAVNGTGIVRVEKGGVSKEYVIEFKVASKPVLPVSMTLAPDKSEKGWMATGNVIGIGDSGKLKAYLALDNGNTVVAGNEAYPVTYRVTDEEIGVVEGNVFKAKSEGAIRIIAEYKLGEIVVSSKFTAYVIEKEPKGPFATVAGVSASKDDGNIPQNVIDRNRDTRWSADGSQEYLLLELDKEEVINKVSALFYSGDTRSSKFDLEVSTDGITYTRVLTNMSSTQKSPNNFDTYVFAPVKAKYVKYIGHGNSVNTWNSIIDFWVHVPVALNKSSSTIKAGGTDTLIATIGLNNPKVTFTSNSNAVSVSQAVYDQVYGTTSVKITGVAAGTAVITATTEEGGYTAQATVTVTQPATAVSLNKNTAALKVGESDTLVATVSPANAANKAVTFASNTSAVTVSQAVYNPANGMTSVTITGAAVGEAKITVTTADGGKTAECTVRVTSRSKSTNETPGPVLTPGETPKPQESILENGKILAKPILEGEKGVVRLSRELIDNALKVAAVNSKGNKELFIEVPELKSAKQYVLQLPPTLLSASTPNLEIKVETPLGSLLIPGNLLVGSDIKGEAPVELTIVAGNTTGIKDDAIAAIGSKPVIELFLRRDGRPLEWKDSQATVQVALSCRPTPEELKNPEYIVVWYLDQNGNRMPVHSGKYNVNTGKVTFTTNHFSRYAVAYYQKTFDDAADYLWAKKEIEVLASKGIISGTTEKTYDPDARIKRADILLLIVKSLGLTAEVDSNFSDVKQSDYYYEAIGIAKKLGLAQGQGENRFNPEELITRQDMMVFIDRALKVMKKINQEGTSSDLNKFADASLIAPYAAGPASTLVREGLVGGFGEMLNPLEETTRAEAAVVIYRIYHR